MAAALRVVTWNIRSAIGPGPFPDRWWTRIDGDRLREIGAFLAPLEADVIGLQEVALVSTDGELIDNAGDLARQLDMDVHYGAVRSFGVTDGEGLTGAGLFGNAILSRRPTRAVRTVALPRAAAGAFVEPPGADHPMAGLRYTDVPVTIREPRCLLLASIEGLRVGTTHLSHVGSGERRLQAEALASSLADASPALLLGDFNAPIEAAELTPLSDWTDGFTEPPGDASRVSTDDGQRIDLVLARGASISDCRILREAGELSDHYPIVAKVHPDARVRHSP